MSYGYHFYNTDEYGLNTSSRASDELELEVNCVGNHFTETEKFTTNNTRGRLDYYLLYVKDGQLTLYLPEGARVLKPGEFVIIPPRTLYSYSNRDFGKIDYLYVHFTGSAVEERLLEYGIKKYPEINKTAPSNTVTTRFQSIFDACAKQDEYRKRELSVLLERLLISLARRISGAKNSKGLTNAISYVMAHYGEKITLAELARTENLSISRFSAVFKEKTGVSAVDFITKTRLSAACELLLNTDYSIGEISEKVGFSDSHFFSKTFTKRLGVSPSEYRKRLKEQKNG